MRREINLVNIIRNGSDNFSHYGIINPENMTPFLDTRRYYAGLKSWGQSSWQGRYALGII